MATEFKEFRQEAHGHTIPWGTQISDILEVTISNDTWYAVTLPAGVTCKYILAQTRNQGSWLISNESDGDGYFTVPANTQLAINIAGLAGETLFYAKDGDGSTTLEVICID